MRTHALVAALMVATLSTKALAEPLTPIPPGEDKIESLQQGQPAPYSGQLFDNKTALRWGNYLEQYKVRLVIDVEYQKKVDQAKIDFLTNSLLAREDQLKFVMADYQKQVAELRNPPFYKTTWFGVTVGIVGTVAVAATTAYLLHAIN